jgi:DNA-3-methyladenine glycosylase II
MTPGGAYFTAMTLTQFNETLRAAEAHLARRDPVLRRVIKRHGPCAIRPRPHARHFETLVGSIISQQLSTKVADVIKARFSALYAPARFPSPAQILATPDEQLRSIGLSRAKAAYVKDIAAKAGDGSLSFARVGRMTDEEVIASLVQVKGVGEWTAHMFLIFSLGRLDVLPVGDLGVRRAIERAYGLAALPTAAEIEQIAQDRGWRPYCSVSAWYLWRSLEPGP